MAHFCFSLRFDAPDICFHHTLSTAAFASGILNLFLFLQYNLHELLKSSFQPRFLEDSSALTMQSYFCLTIFRNATGLPVLFASDFAIHCSWHRNFQLSTCILHDILEFFMCWINEENKPQFSSIVELRFFDSPLLLFSLRFDASDFSFHIWPYILWSGGRLFSCQSPPGPCISIQWFFVQYGESCETCPRIWQFSISINVPIIDNIFLQRDRHVDVFQWNDASLGTYGLTRGSTWWR